MQGVWQLFDNAFGFVLFEMLVFGKVFIEFGPGTIFKHKTYFSIDYNFINELDDIGMIEFLQRRHLSFDMFDELVFGLEAFGGFETVDFDGDVLVFVKIVGLVDLTESSTTEKFHGQVPIANQLPGHSRHGALLLFVRET